MPRVPTLVKVAASEGGSGPEVGGGWAGAGAGVGAGLGGFTVAPHPLLGSMAAPGPEAQGGTRGDIPANDIAALQHIQPMEWLFKKERIFLLAQFWQQVREATGGAGHVASPLTPPCLPLTLLFSPLPLPPHLPPTHSHMAHSRVVAGRSQGI